MDELKQVLLIVGNGFDLNMELETSYNHFLKYLEENKLSNNLIYELSLRNRKNWVDIEKELENCAIHNLIGIYNEKKKLLFSGDDSSNEWHYEFEKKDYIQLKSFLKTYLLILQNKKFNDLSIKNSYNLLLELCKRNEIFLTILNFNYTNTIERLLDNISYNYVCNIENQSKHIYVHGNLKDNIVFGIEDNDRIEKQHHYLLKSFDTNNNTNINISKLLNNSDEIFFYGYSLGETDTSYFDDFFKECCVYDDKIEEEKKKKITFYHYKEEGYNDLFDRLFTLTNHNMSKFSHFNKVQYIDSNKA